jgi:ATP-dependent exoDNAse (exonuclease V) beta subunit
MTSTLDAPPARRWTPAQQQAIRARERTLVTAAAGSGKTSVLTELVASALAAGELAPDQVCAVTFTEKAAQEMRDRIGARLQELDARDALAQLELARIGTIHSLCATILRLHGTAVGVDPHVGQLDDAQHAWILRDSLAHVLDENADDEDVHWLRARMGDERVEVLLRGIQDISARGDGTATLVDEADVSAILDPKTGEALVDAEAARRTIRATTRLWDQYRDAIESRKHALGRISFDDLERLAVEATRVPQVRLDLRTRWGMLLVDEFQDTNARQYELLDAIGDERLFMVGDEWQSIYRFRGADVDVFRARRDDPAGGAVVPMRENFRSVAPVLDVVNRVFASDELFGDRYEHVNPGTDAQREASAPAVELLVVPDEPLDGEPAGAAKRTREARRVAERVADLVRSGTATPGEIALLYARGTGVDHYADALRAWGLPVLRDASSGYYDQRDVRDVLALLAVVRNHADDASTMTVLAGPLAAVDWTTLATIAAAARERGERVLDVVRTIDEPVARRVAGLVDELTHAAETTSLVALVTRVVALPALEVGAALDVDGAVRVANLRRLVELAASAESIGIRDVSGFLEFVAAQRRDARVGEASIADESVGAVRLMTIHASKGLEFPHVFVIEAASGSSGRSDLVPAPLVDQRGVVHMALPKRDGRCSQTPALEALRALDTDAEREESLRLWYVAMTRARNRLYISGRWDFTPTKAGKPRAMAGALKWLRGALDLPDDLGGADATTLALDGLVQVDTRPARATPEPIWQAHAHTQQVAVPLDLRLDTATPRAAEPAAEPHALQALLRETLAGGRAAEWRRLDGTRLHDAVARLLDAARAGTAADVLLDPEHGPWLTDSARERLAPIVAAPVFSRLVELGAVPEVPYVAGRGDAISSRAVPGGTVAASVDDVDAGRIDALARLDDGRWWIVDWKSTLPIDPDAAFATHGDQLRRYAHVARRAGATGVLVTLVPLDRPAEPVTWGAERDAWSGASLP